MANTYKFKVTTSTLFARNKTSLALKECGRLSKGTVFNASFVEGATGWLKISSIVSGTEGVSGGYKNKYVYIGNENKTYVEVVTDSSGNAQKATTEAKTDSNGKAINTDASGNESTSEDDPTEFFIDDAFTKEYSNRMTSEDYNSQLESGLRVKDLRGIFGMPHQFTALTDPRIDGSTSDDAFGRVYSEKIIKNIPLLLMTPGVPSFMSSFSQEQKAGVIQNMIYKVDGALDNLLDGTSGKYYSLKYAYTDYFYYVNAMLRSAAYFLEIDGISVDGKSLGTLNWMYYSDGDDNIFGHEGLQRFLGPYAGAIAFYADCGTTVDDTFSNATTQSQLASSLNSISDTGREMNFLIGNVGGLAGLKLDALTGQEDLEANIGTVQSYVDDILGSGSIMSNILGKAQTILAGGRIIFPEIWSDSSFSRSYSCKMKLVSPSGDKLAVYLNILVPIYHLLAFCLPRQSDGQAYYSPFLVRAYYKGLFNVDMGIMAGLNITKGAEGEWTIDGLPTVAEVSFEIKDMYEGMFMSKQLSDSDSTGIMSNITELDYIANSCGINVNDQEVFRTVKMYLALGFSGAADRVTIGIFGNIAQYFNQKMVDIFGVF